MRNRRRSLEFIKYGSIIDRLRWRRDHDEPGEPPVSGLGGAVEVPDVEPSNGGPDRGDLANAEISANPASPAGGGGVTQPRTPADPNQRAGAVQPQPQAQTAAQWQSIREAAAAQGYQFDGTVTDDRTALNFLLQQAQRNRDENVYAQLGRQLAPHSDRIRGFLSQSTQPQTATPQRQAWEAPEFDERWGALVEQNQQTGLYYSKPGVDPSIAQKVNSYVEWKAAYDKNPAKVIDGMVEVRARAIANETFQQQFAAQAQQQEISSIVTENRAWLYQVDQAGNQVRDFRGQFIPTPVGAAYIRELQNVQRMGVTNPRQQDALAKQIVRGQYAQAAQQQAWTAQQQATNPQTAAAVNQPNVNPLQALPPTQRAVTPGATEPSAKGQSLQEMMRQALAAQGVTDQDIYNSAGNG